MLQRVFRRIGFLVLCLLLVGGGAETMKAGTPDGEESAECVDLSDRVLQFGGLLEDRSAVPKTMALTSAQEERLSQKLTEGWLNFSSSIDLSEFSSLTASELASVYTDTINRDYRFFYLGNRFTYYTSGSGAITRVVPTYSYTQSEAAGMLTELEEVVEDIVDGVDGSWSEMERALYLNDYLAENCEYDLTYSNYSAYNALVDQKAVCQGYAQAYLALAEKIGLDCEMVTSDNLNHAWNYIQIGSSWYHVDVTWNDPTPDRLGQARHQYFMKSSSYFDVNGDGSHVSGSNDWVFSGGTSYRDASDTTYDSCFWNSVDTGFEYMGGLWYGIEGTSLNTYTCSGSALVRKETVRTITEKWYVLGSKTSAYNGCYTSLAHYGGRMYYSVPDAVYVCDADGRSEKVYTLEDGYLSKGYIYGMHIDSDGDIWICLAASPNVSGVLHMVFQLEHRHLLHYSAAVAATCTTAGQAEYWHCNHCFRYYSVNDDQAGAEYEISDPVIPATGHSYVLTDSREATQTEDGYRTYVCSACGDSYTEEVPAAGAVNIQNASVTLSGTSFSYTGSAVTPSVTVKMDSVTLKEGTDYSLSYQDNVNAGTATVTVAGKGDYAGHTSRSFTIEKAAQDLWVSFDASETVTQKTLTVGSQARIYVRDGSGEYAYISGDSSVAETDGSGVVTAKAIGSVTITVLAPETDNYRENSAVLTLTVAAELTKSNVTLSQSSYVYDGSAKRPAVTVTYGGKTLTSGTDYTAAYSSNVNAGTATVTVTGKGSYTGSAAVTYTIEKAEGNLSVTPASVTLVAGTSTTLGVTLKENGTVRYASGSTGTATVSSAGVVRAVAAGTTSVTVSVPATSNYLADSVTVSVKVEAASAGSASGGTSSGSASGTSGTSSGSASGTSGTSSGSASGTSSGTSSSGTSSSGSTAASAASAKVGDLYTSSESGLEYLVTAVSGSTGTVSVYRLTDKSRTKEVIPITVTFHGITYRVTAVSDSAFSGCTKLKEVQVGSNVKTIGKKAFANCTSLTKVTGCTAVTRVGSQAFYKCTKLASVANMQKLTTIDSKAFYGCTKLTRVGKVKNTITLAKVKTIGASAFYHCRAVKKVNLTSTALTKIGDSAFEGMTALTSFTEKSAKLSSLGKKAFYGDKKLAAVTISTTKLTASKVKSQAFKGIKSTCAFRVPSKKISSYKKIFRAKGAGSRITVSAK